MRIDITGATDLGQVRKDASDRRSEGGGFSYRDDMASNKALART